MAKDFVPRSYQADATKFMLENPRAQMSIDLGLGKTIISLNYLEVLYLYGESHPTLIIAPLRVARNVWGDEIKKWTHLSGLEVSAIVGTPKERLYALKRDCPIYTINFENLVWLTEQIGSKWPFRTVIADESSKLKSHRSHFRKKKDGSLSLVCTGGARTSAIAAIAHRKVLRWHNLTGTPCANSLTDLWGQYFFIDKGFRLGSSYSAFVDRWYKLGYNGYDLTLLPHAEREIQAAVSDVTYLLRAEDYLDLGEEIVNTIYVDLPPTAMKHYLEMEKELFTSINNRGVEAFSAAAMTAKAHQIANGAIYHDDKGNWEPVHTAKIEALQSVIEEASGMPVIVTYQFKSDLERLRKAFPKGRVFDTKPQTERDFKDGKIPVLFLHPDSAGHGVDGLQHVTNIMCMFSLSWNAESRAQVVARIGKVRQYQAGFSRPVYIHQIVARNTVDEIILERIATKCSVEDALKAGLARRNLK